MKKPLSNDGPRKQKTADYKKFISKPAVYLSAIKPAKLQLKIAC